MQFIVLIVLKSYGSFGSPEPPFSYQESLRKTFI